MPAPPARADLFPAGALAPAAAKTKWEEFFDYVLPLLGASGTATDARDALGITMRLAPNFVNSSAQVAQRAGITTNLSTSRQIGQCDNIAVWASGGAVSAGTITQISNAICGTTGYAARAAGVTLTGAGVISHQICMEAKDAVKYKNKTASFSVKVDHDVGANINYTLIVKKPTVADTFSTTTNIATSAAVAVVSATGTTLTLNGVAMGDCSNGIALEVQAACGAVATKNLNCTEFSVDLAQTAQAYVAPYYDDELAHCQRYLPVVPASPAYTLSCMCTGAASALVVVAFKSPARVPITGLTVVSTNPGYVLSTSSSLVALTAAPTFNSASEAGSLLEIVTANGLVAGNATVYANYGARLIFTGAELL